MKNIILSSLLLIVLFIIGVISAPIFLSIYILRRVYGFIIYLVTMIALEITYLCGGDVDKLHARFKEILDEG